MGEKRCSKCGETKSLDKFSPSRKSKSGVASRCKPCHAAEVAESAARHRDKLRKRRAESRRAHRQRNAEAVREINRRYPEKNRARRRVAEALTAGRLVKPLACERCEREVSGRNLQAHHEDYSKPLEVDWLCVDCHTQLHVEKARKAA
jgi:hypothetical protein